MTSEGAGAIAAKRYIRRVLAGEILVGHYVRLAVERHVRDLKDGATRGLTFDQAAAEHAIGFFSFLRHSKGEWGGTTFKLEDWQAFIVWCVFGWRRTADGTRRFRVAYNELARKNGKSTLAAGVGLYLFFADGEPGAEVYTAATKRDQARIVHGEAVRMVKKSPPLRRRIEIFKDNLNVEATASKFEPLGADGDTMDGLNVHGAIVDELHQHRTRGVWDALDTATGSRRQSLIFSITTAGFDRHSVCFEEREYSVKVLERVVDDDARFAFIASLDEGDDWTQEKLWGKANPNLGVSVKLDDLQRKAKTAEAMASYRNAFLTKHLNVWTDQQTAWLNLIKWDACSAAVDAAELAGRTCYGGLDLSNRQDLTAFALIFPPVRTDPLWRLLLRFWIPGDIAAEREQNDRVPYRVWAQEKLIEFTPGNVVDYDFIREAVKQDAARFEIAEIGFDTWNATQIAVQLQNDGLTMKEFRQGFASLSEPSKEFERLVVAGKLAHGGHKVLRWNAANVAVKTDPAGNIKPVKPEHNAGGKRIDGIVASVMALGVAIRTPGEDESVYETRGLRQL